MLSDVWVCVSTFWRVWVFRCLQFGLFGCLTLRFNMFRCMCLVLECLDVWESVFWGVWVFASSFGVFGCLNVCILGCSPLVLACLGVWVSVFLVFGCFSLILACLGVCVL